MSAHNAQGPYKQTTLFFPAPTTKADPLKYAVMSSYLLKDFKTRSKHWINISNIKTFVYTFLVTSL